MIVYCVLESATVNDGLRPSTDVAYSLDQAKRLANDRAGRFAKAGSSWEQSNVPVGPQWITWRREVPGVGYQHIFPTEVFGAPKVDDR